jgi:redox-sensitive bicupin YhaK (pirin superfamily)
VPAAHNGFVHMLEGSARFGVERRLVGPSDVAWLDYPLVENDDISSLWFETETDARFLLVTGLPVREPVVAYGPFVMNTEDEIRKAYTDFHAGRFGGPTPAGIEALERTRD